VSMMIGSVSVTHNFTRTLDRRVRVRVLLTQKIARFNSHPPSIDTKSSMMKLLLISLFPIASSGFSLSDKPVSFLLKEYASKIASLKDQASKAVGDISVEPYLNDVFFLRYALSGDGAESQLKDTLEWRLGAGKNICHAANKAIAEATSDGSWKNGPVLAGAPNSNLISKYLTPATCLTTTTSQGDLIYCIRAGKIDDVALMASLQNVNQLVEFFVYCKEVNAVVANQRSLASDKLVCLITANDLSGVKLIGGDATFRTALSSASKISSKLYPTLNGPTLLLNLPALLGALAKLFTPLFPPEVRKRLKFEQGPLADVSDLMDVSYGGNGRAAFLDEIDKLVYDAN
jgi:hypothetical protein